MTYLSRLRGHKQITDLYLAALAARQGGKLATFDTAIPCDALIGGTDDLVEVIQHSSRGTDGAGAGIPTEPPSRPQVS